MSTEDLEEDNAAPDDPSLAPSSEGAISSVSDNQLPTVNQSEAEPSAERSLARKNVSHEKLCGVCNEMIAKYKCTRCYLP